MKEIIISENVIFLSNPNHCQKLTHNLFIKKITGKTNIIMVCTVCITLNPATEIPLPSVRKGIISIDERAIPAKVKRKK